MTGAVVAAILWGLDRLWKKRHGKTSHLPWLVYVTIGFISLLLAGYVVWLDEYGKFQKAEIDKQGLTKKLEDRKPNLKASIRQAYIYSPYNLVAALIEIENSGGTASSARDFKLVLPGVAANPVIDRQMGILHIELGIPPNNIDMVFRLDELIQRRATTSAIEPGNSVRGWFVFADLARQQLEIRNAAISFYDIVLRETRSVPLIEPRQIPPLPPYGEFQGYPDITSPFRERTAIESLGKRLNVDVLRVVESNKR